jgi:glycosyltransferase involved in cell wall biosynthesis
LLVTLPVAQRFAYFQRSVTAYCRQTYPHRELIVVLDSGPAEIRAAMLAYLAGLARSDIHVIEAPDKCSLGRLRNLSRGAAHGEVLCQWDDDDLHHPRRLEQQLQALQNTNGQAVCLQEVMQYFPRTRSLYCINWRLTEAKGHPGTLMCRRSAAIKYPESGPEAQRGEDLAVARQLQQRKGYGVLAGAPHLYVYVSHGINTWAADHHRMLATKLALSQGLLRRREAQLRQGLEPFDFGPGTVVVQGNNGAAFTLEPVA